MQGRDLDLRQQPKQHVNTIAPYENDRTFDK